jgi:hypothetical protein
MPVTSSQRRPQLEALLRRFLSTMAEPRELQRLIEANPEILGDDFDTLLVQFVASLRYGGEAEQAQLVERYRWLLVECRRLGVAGAFVKANAYAVMGGFLRAEGPDGKLAYLRAHPELDDMTNRAALYQMIDEAQAAGNGEQVRFLRSHLMLLDAAVMTSPEEAVNRAFRRG